MNAHTVPVSSADPWKDADTLDAQVERVWCPMGHDAPRHSVEWSNYTAASIAAREVRGRAIHSEPHRRSLAEWEAGLRDWPWPDATDAEQARADASIRRLAKGQAQFKRSGL
jgi:hypothetical protein